MGQWRHEGSVNHSFFHSLAWTPYSGSRMALWTSHRVRRFERRIFRRIAILCFKLGPKKLEVHND
jgi:hypothetical protein